MLDPRHFKEHVIKPTLTDMRMWSTSAENLLLGTALVESNLTYLTQHHNGPAKGLYQIEPATALDIVQRYFTKRPDIEKLVEEGVYTLSQADINWNNIDIAKLSQRLITDLRLSTALVRIKYWMVPAPLPPEDDVEGLARYWKKWYNTAQGKGRETDFIRKYRAYQRSFS